MIYLDNNATTRVDEEVLRSMLPYLGGHFTNPSAPYSPARQVRRAVEMAREAVAGLVHAEPDEVTFTSCGTESVNAVHQSVRALWPERQGLIITGTEHAAVLESAKRWRAQGGQVIVAPVMADGRVDLAGLEDALGRMEAALVSIMWANNETGVIAPMREIVERAHAAGALVHTDAVQAVGKIAVNVREVPVDFLSLSGHKMHAPKGIGALYASRRVRSQPLIVGGGQEHGRRSGTENVPGIIALGAAAGLLSRQGGGLDHIAAMRDAFEAAILAGAPGAFAHGSSEHRLATTTSLCLPGSDAAGLLILLDQRGVCCSAGSACHTAGAHPSHVLEAMGVSAAAAACSLRFSFSRFNTMEETRTAAEEVLRAARRIRELKGLDNGPVRLSD